MPRLVSFILILLSALFITTPAFSVETSQDHIILPTPPEEKESPPELTPPPPEEEEPSPETPPEEPRTQHISGHIWVDKNSDGKKNKTELSLSSSMKVTLTDGTVLTSPMSETSQRGAWGRTEPHMFSPIEVEKDSLKEITVAVPEGFVSSSNTLSKEDLKTQGDLLVAAVPVKPDASFSVDESHSTDDGVYHLVYTLKNTGTAPLVINDIGLCGTVTLNAGKSHTCERKASYHVEKKDLVITNVFTADFNHDGQLITQLSQDTQTVITDKTAKESRSNPASVKKITEVAPEQESDPAPESETDPTEEPQPWWLLVIPGLLLLAALIVHVYYKRKLRKNVNNPSKSPKEVPYAYTEGLTIRSQSRE